MAKKSTRKTTASKKTVETLTHDEAKRSNIPTAELETVMEDKEAYSIQVAIERRNPDLDPQLVWRGKDTRNWSDLVVNTPPLFIQEKVHPKVLIDDLRRRTEEQESSGEVHQLDLFSDFNGLPSPAAKTEFYQHESNWTNRMILVPQLAFDLSPATVSCRFTPENVSPIYPCCPFEICKKKPSLSHVVENSYISTHEKRKAMSGKAAKVIVTEKQFAILEQIAEEAK